MKRAVIYCGVTSTEQKKMENKLSVCFYCYREVPADGMKKQVDGQVSNQCQGCYDILGGKRGFGGNATQDENEWFRDIAYRKYMLKREGKLSKK